MRAAAAPGTNEEKYRSVRDVICSKPELSVAGIIKKNSCTKRKRTPDYFDPYSNSVI